MKWPRKALLTDPIDDSGSDGWQQEMSGKHEIMQPPPGLFPLLFLGEVENGKKVKVKVDKMRGIGCQQGGEWKV